MKPLILAAFLWLNSSQATAAKNPEKIVMRAGEARTIQLPEARRVRVSRKGIIHLIHDHDDSWSVTALRTGVVAIETKIKSPDPSILYIDVQPRMPARVMPKIKREAVSTSLEDPCDNMIANDQFEIHTTIELADDTNVEVSGVKSDVKLQLSASETAGTVNLNIEPHKSSYKRRIVGDPVLTTRQCEDVVIRAGGEDEFESKSDSGHIVSSWKTHGLDIRMKLTPISETKLRVPFSVSLRTPSKGRGSYSLSDITSSIDVILGKKILAAIINLSSASESTKEPLWITSIPIIGPFFRQSDESRSSSKLLLWFEIFQRSAESPNP